MRRIKIVSSLFIIIGLIGAGCAQFPSARQDEQTPTPTFDSAVLTVSPQPTSTPYPTYTPRPAIERLPTRTPIPTLAPYLTPIPLTPESDGSGAPGGGQSPDATPTLDPGYVGIQGAGPEVADLVPILTVAGAGSVCNEWMLVQVGVINRGTGPAYNFHVEWSLGWGAMLQTEFVDELQWGRTPIHFYNGTIKVPCEQTSTYTAWIRVDTQSDVDELFEDNNYDEETYTVTFVNPND